MEANMSVLVRLIASLVLGGILGCFGYLYNALVLKPKRLRSRLQKQGIGGPSPSFLLGNIAEMKRIHSQVQTRLASANEKESHNIASIAHDWPSYVTPHFHNWINQFGPTFMYSTGNIHMLCITNKDMVREISLYTSLSLGKPSYLSKDRGPLLGQSIMSTSGQIWVHQRKIIAPEFYINRVKSMVSLMVDSTNSVLKTWESRIERGGGIAEINVDADMTCLSADIISRACFGSNYAQGEEIFLKLKALQNFMSKCYVGIPGLRYLPTKINREVWKLEKEINSMILQVVKQRAAANYEKDLLQMILEGANGVESNGGGLSPLASVDKFIVDNCKAIYFAGHETTAITASWSLMLLAAHPVWQDQSRAEVLEICKDGIPDSHMLQNMKILTMVIQETLRLYPPAIFLIRTALQDIKLKDIVIPKGMDIQIPIAIMQQNPEIWGPDATQFNPERFAGGVIEATRGHPQAYMPFGVGGRTCAGQNFAMAEMKVILALILSKFSFSLSPAFRHSPVFKLVVQPGDGVKLQVRKLPQSDQLEFKI